MAESFQHLIDILVTAVVAGLGWLYRGLVGDIKELNNELVEIKTKYASRGDLKDLQEVIERGFNRLEDKLDKKQDK